MQVQRKETAKLRGRDCLFNSEWARTFPGIRASNQSAAKAYCVACNICILVSSTAEDTMAVGDEIGLLTKKMWRTTVSFAPPGGGKNTNYRFSHFFGLSRFFVR